MGRAKPRALLLIPARTCTTCDSVYRDPQDDHARCALCVRRLKLRVIALTGGRRPSADCLAREWQFPCVRRASLRIAGRGRGRAHPSGRLRSDPCADTSKAGSHLRCGAPWARCNPLAACYGAISATVSQPAARSLNPATTGANRAARAVTTVTRFDFTRAAPSNGRYSVCCGRPECDHYHAERPDLSQAFFTWNAPWRS